MVETNDIIKDDKEEVPQKKRGRPKKYSEGWNSVKNAYFREYYKNNMTGSFKCEICGKELSAKTSMRLHQLRNKNCAIVQLKRELEESKNKENDN
jgi:transcription initiation factor IIE alpha subunit